MSIFYKLILGSFLFLLCTPVLSQDTLYLKNGNKLPFENMDQFLGLIEVVTPDQERLSFPGDSVLGYEDVLNSESYYIKPVPGYDEEYTYLKRVAKGPISLFEDMTVGYTLYGEKGDTFEVLFEISGGAQAKKERLAIFEEMVADDQESVAYVQDMSYKFKEFLTVVEHYNRRNFKPAKKKTAHKGTVYLYRTRFQKTKDRIRVRYRSEQSDLYINDFIQIELPVSKATRVTFFDSSTKNEIIMAGDLKDQYFEVLYDKKSDTFILEPKDGSELIYEFFKIQDKVYKKTGE